MSKAVAKAVAKPKAHPHVQVRRIYEDAEPSDGARVLVDRVWPRGISKDKAHIDEWCKDVAPSTDLRKWYAHDPERFDEFSRRYRAELKDPARAAALARIGELAHAGAVTLLTATKDAAISQAAVLRDVLSGRR
ncbi:MAG: DUF488 domain-containing protein [Acidothermaceae bacterium]